MARLKERFTRRATEKRRQWNDQNYLCDRPGGREADDEGRGPRGICPGGAGHRVRGGELPDADAGVQRCGGRTHLELHLSGQGRPGGERRDRRQRPHAGQVRACGRRSDSAGRAVPGECELQGELQMQPGGGLAAVCGNGDDRCLRQKQGGAVGAAAGRMQAERSRRREPQPGGAFRFAAVCGRRRRCGRRHWRSCGGRKGGVCSRPGQRPGGCCR